MLLLDVNALVALAWDTHVHHASVTDWFDRSDRPWATCSVTEAGFVRLSSNPRVIQGALTVTEACEVLRQLRSVGDHRFLSVDVSLTDADLPRMTGHKQVTDALLLAVARRAGATLLTFDSAIVALADGSDVEVLTR